MGPQEAGPVILRSQSCGISGGPQRKRTKIAGAAPSSLPTIDEEGENDRDAPTAREEKLPTLPAEGLAFGTRSRARQLIPRNFPAGADPL